MRRDEEIYPILTWDEYGSDDWSIVAHVEGSYFPGFAEPEMYYLQVHTDGSYRVRIVRRSPTNNENMPKFYLVREYKDSNPRNLASAGQWMMRKAAREYIERNLFDRER